MLQTIDDDTASLHRLVTEPAAGLGSRMEERAACSRRKDAFLGVLGHELRSPLASIQNAVLILGSQTHQTPARQSAQALIQRQVYRMAKLIDDPFGRLTHNARTAVCTARTDRSTLHNFERRSACELGCYRLHSSECGLCELPLKGRAISAGRGPAGGGREARSSGSRNGGS